jgi:DNA helicase II / ATP-dependent DNA helicase PcrA
VPRVDRPAPLIRPVSGDLEQARVIEAPVSARLEVVAGPGTGKTFTLLARAAWLADREEVEPATELLVLSFSRAAVETVARRGSVETHLGRIPVSTVDSFASRLLIEVGTDLSGSFEDRIVKATAVLADGELPEMVGAIRHVLIDEAQDVVGVRATFVRALLGQVCRDSGSGFTVFGDSAQAIFDFQMGSRPETRKRLLTLLETEGPEAESRELKTNHRMESERLAQFATSAGEALRESKAGDWAELHRGISGQVFLESGWGDLDAAAAAIRAIRERPERPRVAVLCRTNAEALYLGSYLQAAGLEVSVRHRAQDRGGAPWLAGLFADCPVGKAPIPTDPPVPGERPWMSPPADLGRVLRLAGLAGSKDVDLSRLASLLRCGACPEELAGQWDTPVTVSTVHRAKGLEYDVVFVVENARPHEEDEWFEEAKVAYVAGTRARSQLLGTPALKLGGPIKQLEGGGRVAVCHWRQDRQSRPRLIEVKVSDSDAGWAPSDREEFDRVQEVLRERLLPGDPIELRLRPASDGYQPRFDVVHLPGSPEESVIGATDRYFGQMLKREVLGRTARQIGDLTADIPDTAALPAVTARELGLGEHGLHLRVRVYGLGRMEWRRD